MRISWGYKIFIGYSLFVAGMLFLVFKAHQQHFDLVTENYYEEELKYQEVIDQQNRTAALSAPPEYLREANTVTVNLPAEFQGQPVKGEIHLYRPSDAAKDTRLPFSTATAAHRFQLHGAFPGSYLVKLRWEAGGKTFYHEGYLFF